MKKIVVLSLVAVVGLVFGVVSDTDRFGEDRDLVGLNNSSTGFGGKAEFAEAKVEVKVER